MFELSLTLDRIHFETDLIINRLDLRQSGKTGFLVKIYSLLNQTVHSLPQLYLPLGFCQLHLFLLLTQMNLRFYNF